jgi:hypothetical protein
VRAYSDVSAQSFRGAHRGAHGAEGEGFSVRAC